MDCIIKSRWEFLIFCIFAFFAFEYIEDQNIQKWLYAALGVIFCIFSGALLTNIKNTGLIKRKNNKFYILSSLLWILLLIISIFIFSNSFSKFYLVLYQISFFGLCILIIAPIIKIPSSDEGIITRNLKSIREGQISLISLYNLDLLLRKFQMDYIIKKTLDNKITGEQKFKITVKFSPEFLKRIRNTEDRINIEEIIKSIQIKAEDAVKKENFHKPIEMLRLNYNIKGEVTVSYLT